MTNEDILFFETINRELMMLSSSAQSIPALAYAATNIANEMFGKINGAREKALIDLQNNNGPVARRFKENARINSLILRSEGSDQVRLLPGEEYILHLSPARYGEESRLNYQKLRELFAKYISIFSNESLHIHKEPFNVQKLKDPRTGFVMSTVYETAGANQKVRSLVKVSPEITQGRVDLKIELQEKSGCIKKFLLSFSLDTISSVNTGAVEVSDVLENCTFQGTYDHIHHDDIRQIVEHYFHKNEIEVDENNVVAYAEGQLLASCEEKLRKHFYNFSIPFIEKLKDAASESERPQTFYKTGRSKFNDGSGWSRSIEISFTTDMEGKLISLDYYFYMPRPADSRQRSSERIEVRYQQSTGLYLFYNNRALQFTQSTFDFILDQLKNETFEY